MNREMARLTLPARVDRLGAFCAFVREGAASGLPADDLDRLELVLEEIFMNVARHAYAPGEGDVEVAYAVDGPGRLFVEISDAGREFDPLAAPVPDLSLSLADRPVGGLGILMVKALTTSLQYRRDGGRNRLSFLFPGPASGF
jgi:serine/threonine-protein kinase RsbW